MCILHIYIYIYICNFTRQAPQKKTEIRMDPNTFRLQTIIFPILHEIYNVQVTLKGIEALIFLILSSVIIQN